MEERTISSYFGASGRGSVDIYSNAYLTASPRPTEGDLLIGETECILEKPWDSRT